MALSSAEAEYMALSLCTQEVVWVRNLLHELGVTEHEATTICVDNQNAVAIAVNMRDQSRAKHIDIRHHFVRDHVATKTTELQYVPTKFQFADYLTKPLPMLFNVIGAAALAGLGVIGMSMLASFFVVKVSGQAFEDIMTRKDDRMKVIKEVFGAIQIVKLNAWEGKFANKIGRLRARELQAVIKHMYTTAVEIFIIGSIPVFVSSVPFTVYALVMERTLTTATVFTVIALFDALRNPLTDLPVVTQHLLQAKCAASGKRVVVCSKMYTSRTCAQCDRLHLKLGSKDVFDCSHCAYTAGWDENAVFSILRYVCAGSLQIHA